MRTIIVFLLTLLVLVAGTLAVVASPKFTLAAATPTPSPLFVIENPPPTPSPTPTPTPTPVATPSGIVTIAMPVDKQTMALDCETAALQMGLAALGHNYTQTDLFASEPQDKRAPVMGPNKKVIMWGDPYTSFVGNVNGSDLGPTGYGIYYPVILSIAKSHGAPSSTGGEGVTAAQVYEALANGHPVLVWVETGWENAKAAGYTGVWTSWPDTGSKRIPYSLIEHVVTLSGVSPTQVRVNDPWKSGSQYWFNKSAFEASWADFNNMAIVLK